MNQQKEELEEFIDKPVEFLDDELVEGDEYYIDEKISDTQLQDLSLEEIKKREIIEYLLKDSYPGRGNSKSSRRSRIPAKPFQNMQQSNFTAFSKQAKCSKQPSQLRNKQNTSNYVQRGKREHQKSKERNTSKSSKNYKQIIERINSNFRPQIIKSKSSRNFHKDSRTNESIHDRLHKQKCGKQREFILKVANKNKEKEEKELTFQPKKIAKTSSRTHIGFKKSSVSTYRECSKTTNLHERLAQEKLKQKDEEIERLKKELQDYKNKPKKRKSVDPCSKFRRSKHPLHVKRSSKSPS